ncbi:hypothetical protein C8Q75DRAFT_812165 [Abortiporus biennis]|nr:hypothetical protein C8Q75DRAFT_812165 [Abortiporus biennis]
MSGPDVEHLVLKFANIIDLICTRGAQNDPQLKHVLVKEINDFKEDMNQAKNAANTLPGGDLTMDDQDDVIRMLEQLRNQRRDILVNAIGEMKSSSEEQTDIKDMEIDSTASTPA